MTERQEKVLAAVIVEYLHSVKPISSKRVQQRSLVSFCTATIRREMHLLEEIGFLSHPHTSAGRVPTEKGWRYYLEKLLPSFPLSEEDLRQLLPLPFAKENQEGIIQTQLKKLSEYLKAVSIFSHPLRQEERIVHLNAVPLGTQIILIMITDRGRVYQTKFETKDKKLLKRMVQLVLRIRTLFKGKECTVLLNPKVYSDGMAAGNNIGLTSKQVGILFGNILSMTEQSKVYIEGRTFVLSQKNWHTHAADLLRFLSDKRKVTELMSTLSASQPLRLASKIEIALGSQMPFPALSDSALLAIRLSRRGKNWGSLSVLGPINTHYPKVVASLKVVERNLSERLQPALLSQ